MRELKFDIMFWDGSDKNTITHLSIEEAIKEDFIQLFGDVMKPTDECTIIRQFTGLKDKNGKEIYEGDIVTGYTSYERDSDEREWTKEEPCEVEWDERAGGFYPFILNNRWRCDVEEIEIIGNIYENSNINV